MVLIAPIDSFITCPENHSTKDTNLHLPPNNKNYVDYSYNSWKCVQTISGHKRNGV